MKLPNGAHAEVAIAKLRDYCLSPVHPRGRHKALVFLSALGINDSHAEDVREALLRAAQYENALPGAFDKYGSRYIIDFELRHRFRSALIRSVWIVRSGEIAPRFVTCFVL